MARLAQCYAPTIASTPLILKPQLLAVKALRSHSSTAPAAKAQPRGNPAGNGWDALSRVACVFCASITTSSGFVPAANAAIVTNGDFATGNFTGWTLFTTANGSLGPSGSGLPAVTSFNVTGSGSQNAATFDVGEVVQMFMQGGGGITQTVTLPGDSISFSANIAALGLGVAANVEGGVFSVLLDGLTEDTVDIGFIGAGAVIRNTLSFTTTESAGPHTLEILITRPFVNNAITPEQFITNIAIAGAAAVPEPASLGLLAAGLVGLAGVRHRRRGDRDRN